MSCYTKAKNKLQITHYSQWKVNCFSALLGNRELVQKCILQFQARCIYGQGHNARNVFAIYDVFKGELMSGPTKNDWCNIVRRFAKNGFSAIALVHWMRSTLWYRLRLTLLALVDADCIFCGVGMVRMGAVTMLGISRSRIWEEQSRKASWTCQMMHI